MPPPSLPIEICAAIIQITLEAPSLRKEDQNEYAGYAFASIDTYYATIKKLAATHGLGWTMREVATKFDGKTVAFTYEFDLFHKSGGYVPRADRLTVYHPLQGAQTCGSARSYADKAFMRVLFGVVTGEIEADMTDNKHDIAMAPESQDIERDAIMNEPSADARPLSEDELKTIISHRDANGMPAFKPADPQNLAYPWDWVRTVFIEFMPLAGTIPALHTWWEDNSGILADMEQHQSAMYHEIKREFVKQSNLLMAN